VVSPFLHDKILGKVKNHDGNLSEVDEHFRKSLGESASSDTSAKGTYYVGTILTSFFLSTIFS